MYSNGTAVARANDNAVAAANSDLYCPSDSARHTDMIAWVHELSRQHSSAWQQPQRSDLLDLTHLRCDVAKITGCRTIKFANRYQHYFRVEWHPTIFQKANLSLFSKALVHGQPIIEYAAGIKPCEDDPDYGDDADSILILWKDSWVPADAMSWDEEVPAFWETSTDDFRRHVTCVCPFCCGLPFFGLNAWQGRSVSNA